MCLLAFLHRSSDYSHHKSLMFAHHFVAEYASMCWLAFLRHSSDYSHHKSLMFAHHFVAEYASMCLLAFLRHSSDYSHRKSLMFAHHFVAEYASMCLLVVLHHPSLHSPLAAHVLTCLLHPPLQHQHTNLPLIAVPYHTQIQQCSICKFANELNEPNCK